ncbi:hypothetical protein SSP35_11_01210 [Streptomyces sp. NBRC 110611]|uniref:hypothetical protein n=1 Tax=Streptomyces sp. NBRC 110611 TaxID=1621259 RepID=UPI000831E130|nr:hypothetical protein [Streptomyces sp. NBRC 110611]GAU69302.1 hypothetical protein SSP35_11_01210 [Streptomyces sp. NBRC 110611]
MPAAVWTGRNASPEKVASGIAAALGSELGLAEPPLTEPLPAESTGVPAGSLLPPRERFSGMPAPTHCFAYVDAPTPRAFELRASVMSGRAGIRRSLGLGHLVYAVPLEPQVPSRIQLSAAPARGSVNAGPAISGSASAGPAISGSANSGSANALFEGDAVLANRLNSDAQLLDLAQALTPATAGPDQYHTWQVAQRLTIDPLPHGSVLIIQTLHRPTARGWSLGARTVLDFAARAEAALRRHHV